MWSDNETTEDLLGFKVHADLISEVVKDDDLLPITIGVFGDWGSGKSSILKITSEILNELDDGTYVLYFNGWLFEGYDDAKAALLESIVKEFESNSKFGEEVKVKAKKLLKSVDWMRVLGLGFKNVALPVATAYLTGGASLIPQLASQLGSFASTDLSEKLKGEDAQGFLQSLIQKEEYQDKSMLVREFRDGFSDLIEKSKIKKLVVVIDDLDRCTPDRIIENLEAIKLFLNAPKTAFIIGADPRIVRHAIEFRYHTKVTEGSRDLDDYNKRIIDDYLEKLIQVPYSLPKLSDSEVETYISLLFAKRDLDEVSFKKVLDVFHSFRESNKYSVFGLSNLKSELKDIDFQKLSEGLSSIPALAPLITQSLYGNPRQIKRFLNTFTLRKRLADVAKIQGFKDSILAKLMILEYSEPNLFKQLYDWQIVQDGRPDEVKTLEINCESGTLNKKKGKIEEDFSKWAKEKTIRWLTVDPKLQDVDLRDYYWLSRDQITSTILGSSLIPPFIKSLFNKLNQGDLPGNVTKRIVSSEIRVLPESDQEQFLVYTASHLKKTSEKRVHQIFLYLIEEKIQDAENFYKDALLSVTPKGVEAATANNLRSLEVSEPFREFLDEFFKGGQSRASKAYNIGK